MLITVSAYRVNVWLFCWKVDEWAEGKRGNIRALLCGLHLILWDGEERWEPCGMHNLVKPAQVRAKCWRLLAHVFNPYDQQ